MQKQRHIYYIFNSKDDLKDLVNISDNKNELTSFCHNKTANFKKITILYWLQDIKYLADLNELFEELHSFEICNYIPLPADAFNDNTKLVNFLVKLSSEISTNEENYLFIRSLNFFSRTRLYGISSSGTFNFNFVEVEIADNKAWPGVIKLYSNDLSSHTEITYSAKASTASPNSNTLRSGIPTRNHNYNEMMDELATVAVKSNAPILFLGPTGSGKSQLAKKIFELKKETGTITGQYVELNCASVQGTLAQSMLFGHARGAFTGATCAREGLLRKANNGLLFLDEIGTLGLEEQALLLKAIEEKVFYPLGSDKEVSSNFQIICGSNQDLYEEVKNGSFREDLLSRCNTWTFTLPGLAERPEDIEPNMDYELQQFKDTTGLRLEFDEIARKLFLEFATSDKGKWTGNFRDFSSSIQRMSAFAKNGFIRKETVLREIERLNEQWARSQESNNIPVNNFNFETPSYPHILRLLGDESLTKLDLFELPQLECVLRVCSNSRNLSEAGRRLYAVSRQTRNSSNDSDRLRKYLNRFGLSWAKISDKTTKGHDPLQAKMDQPDNSKSCRLN